MRHRWNVVICDLDGVLRVWDPALAARTEQRHGLPEGALSRAAFEDVTTLAAVTTGRMTDATWRRGIADTLTAVHGTAAARAVGEWSEPCGSVDLGVLQLLRAERRRRRVVILSNATDRLEKDLQRLGLLTEVDGVFNSSALGVAKPDPQVFREVCSRLAAEPARCLFIDDSSTHVEAARAVGLVGHVYAGVARLAEFLDAHPASA